MRSSPISRPFRGIAADTGTVFELGFMCGRGKIAFAYSNVADDHYARTFGLLRRRHRHRTPDGRVRGPMGSRSKTST